MKSTQYHEYVIIAVFLECPFILMQKLVYA